MANTFSKSTLFLGPDHPTTTDGFTCTTLQYAGGFTRGNVGMCVHLLIQSKWYSDAKTGHHTNTL